MTDRIAIIGAGAIGGYFGAGLVRAGREVTLIDGWAEHVEHVRTHGLTIEGIGKEGHYSVRPRMLHLNEAQGLVAEPPFDMVIVAVKSYDTRWAVELMRMYAARSAALVSLQNSFNEPEIASIVGTENTFGCAIQSLACDLVAPGLVCRMSATGTVGVGAMSGDTSDPRLADLVDCLSEVEVTHVVRDLPGIKWSKLVVNSMRNGLSAMTGMTGGERDSHPETIALGIRLGAQTVKVGRAMGLTLVDTAYDFDTLVAAGAGSDNAVEAIRSRMTEIASARSAEQRPSMAQDVRKGRRTETEAINGLVARKGRELGIEVGAHEKVHDIIRRIERGELTPGPELARDIA
ncbi:ketopantoate reductase family protein [Alterinioella nitratireducens]|uniref:ketopantoate reductase family protein n=1 Tax=Alterinioella nitratireducens TaxID=2735915 RepID=UPI00405A13F7